MRAGTALRQGFGMIHKAFVLRMNHDCLFETFDIPHPQGRDKLKIAETDDLQSFGIAREACALKGER